MVSVPIKYVTANENKIANTHLHTIEYGLAENEMESGAVKTKI